MKTVRLLTTFVLCGGLVLGAFAGGISAAAAADKTPLYYRDPGGAPRWSAEPRKDDRGRDYLPVYDDDQAVPTEAKPQAGAPRKILYYRNPMGLPDTSPVPKKDSMGMNYIPVYEGDDTDDGTVEAFAGQDPADGRQVGSRRAACDPGCGEGARHDPARRTARVRRSRCVPRVLSRRSRDVTTGTRVKAGQPLMEIYSSAVASAAAEYLATITSRTVGGVETYGRGSRQRLINLDVPEPVIAEMEKTHVAPVTVRWSAPRDGIVLERNAIEGMRANPGDVLFRIADTSVVWALIDVAERDLGNIAVGQPVAVRARSFAGRTFAGKITVIYPQVNRDTRTVRVRIELANPDAVLLPDMYVDADIDTGRSRTRSGGARKTPCSTPAAGRPFSSTRGRAF